MQVRVPDFIELRLWRRRHHDEILVLVTAALNLVWRAQYVDEDLEMPAAIAAGWIAKISVRFEQRFGNAPVISGDHLIASRLRPLPKILDVGLAIKSREQRTEPVKFSDIQRDLGRRHSEFKLRRFHGERKGYILAQIGVRVALRVRRVELFQGLHRRQVLRGDDVSNLLANARRGRRVQPGIVAGHVNRGEDSKQRLAGVELALLSRRLRVYQDGGDGQE